MNYKKSGDLFYNRLVLLPIKVSGVQNYIGLQCDTTHNERLLELTEPRTLEELQQSEMVKDLFRTPLMKISMIIESNLQDEESIKHLTDSLNQIRQRVLTLHEKRN